MRFLSAVTVLAICVPQVAWAQATAPSPEKSGEAAAAGASPSPAAAGPAAAPASEAVAPAPTAAGAPAATGEGSSGSSAASPTAAAAPQVKGPTAVGSPTPSEGAMDGATYAVRLRDLEQRIDELKEQIRRSHTRLSLLSDTILSGGVGGARAEIKFVNEMSNAFRLTSALFVLDGAVQYNKQDDSGALAEQKEIPIFNGAVPSGDHTLQVALKLRGHGYGVFSYLRGYQFDAKSSHSFTITEGKTVQVEVVAYEKGGVTTPLEERPAIRYGQKLSSGVQGDGAAPQASSGASITPKSASGNINLGTGGK
ncbi:MAG: hypothetical protein SFV15_04290 [Polyangiaceae bacterium]|nr:hypothetical protein [Polyangiaceae bacterium]